MQKAVSIIEVNSRSDLKRWVKLPLDMYRNNPCYVPQILREEVAFFTSKNPVFEIVKMKQFLALMGNTPVGRICGIIHSYEEEKLGYRRGRFGWFDTIDDYEVSHLLLTRVREWLESEGCREMTGPHGFTDLDPEGLLIEGFEELATISTSYNFPYYQKHLERFGLAKDIDYQEFLITLPVEEPPLLIRMRKHMERETEFRVLQCRSKKEMMGHAAQFWELLDVSFQDLYGVVPLSLKQKDFYTQKYLSYLDPFFVHFVFTGEDKMVGFYLGLPNLSRGFQKAKSHLFPFGLFHILRELKKTDTVDFLLAGAHPDYSPRKILMLLTLSMYDACKKRGIKYAETNHELETNTQVTGIWSKFDARLHRRSRIYKLGLKESPCGQINPGA